MDNTQQEIMRQQDKEANLFALALLMPKEIFIGEVHKENWDLADEYDSPLKRLAKKFGVSTNAVCARIAMLKLF